MSVHLIILIFDNWMVGKWYLLLIWIFWWLVRIENFLLVISYFSSCLFWALVCCVLPSPPLKRRKLRYWDGANYSTKMILTCWRLNIWFMADLELGFNYLDFKSFLQDGRQWSWQANVYGRVVCIHVWKTWILSHFFHCPAVWPRAGHLEENRKNELSRILKNKNATYFTGLRYGTHIYGHHLTHYCTKICGDLYSWFI